MAGGPAPETGLWSLPVRTGRPLVPAYIEQWRAWEGEIKVLSIAATALRLALQAAPAMPPAELFPLHVTHSLPTATE